MSRGIARVLYEFSRFLLVGAVGFIVDGGALMLLVHGGEFSPVWSRIPSFLVAVTVTWWLHRHFTFTRIRGVAPSFAEWLRFVTGNAVGNAANLTIYWFLLGIVGWSPLIALAVASVVATGVNYTMSARWVFVPSRRED